VAVVGSLASDELTSLRLAPVDGARSPLDEASRFFSRAASLRAGGGFEIEHVAPGVYRLIGASAAGKETAIGGSIVVSGEAPLQLGTLRAEAPKGLGIQVLPAADGFGGAWEVTLATGRRADGDRQQRVRLDASGWAQLDDLPSGDYLFRITDSQGSLWALERRTCDGGVEQFVVPHVPVDGRVHSGDRPLAALVIFGTTQGERSIRMRSGKDGELHGFLPHAGRWQVELGREDVGCGDCNEPGAVEVPAVDVVPGPGGKAFVDVAVPDTVVKGRVVVVEDGQARGVSGALVMMMRTDGAASERGRKGQLWSDADGRFEVRGLAPGPLRMAALAADESRESAWAELAVAEGSEPPEVELRLEDNVDLRVRCSVDGKPLPGTEVLGFPSASVSARAFTDASGTATLRVAPGATGAGLCSAPGYGFALAPRVAEGAESGLAVDIAAEPGELVLHGVGGFPYPGALLGPGGVRFDLQLLRNFLGWSWEVGADGLRVKGVSAGHYALCLDEPQRCRPFDVVAGRRTAMSVEDWR
jgi:hypothetical protein